MPDTLISAQKAANAVVQRQSTLLENCSVKEFLQRFDLVDYHKLVRTNSNGLPYITFINSKNEAMNIYFSIALGATVAADDAVASLPFKSYVMSHISYPAAVDSITGEVKPAYSVWKIGSGNSMRAKTADLDL